MKHLLIIPLVAAAYAVAQDADPSPTVDAPPAQVEAPPEFSLLGQFLDYETNEYVSFLELEKRHAARGRVPNHFGNVRPIRPAFITDGAHLLRQNEAIRRGQLNERIRWMQQRGLL